jgi:hypothetical protein
MGTGYKTKDGAIGYGVIANTSVNSTAEAADFVSLTNIGQIARRLGKAAGCGIKRAIKSRYAWGSGSS